MDTVRSYGTELITCGDQYLLKEQGTDLNLCSVKED